MLKIKISKPFSFRRSYERTASEERKGGGATARKTSAHKRKTLLKGEEKNVNNTGKKD